MDFLDRVMLTYFSPKSSVSRDQKLSAALKKMPGECHSAFNVGRS